jgi:hypothetical protein
MPPWTLALAPDEALRGLRHRVPTTLAFGERMQVSWIVKIPLVCIRVMIAEADLQLEVMV